MEEHRYELIVCIVNAGFSQNVMEAARAAGAQGGTILRARGAANPEAEEFFNINIQADKEMVLILVPKTIKDDVLKAIYKDCGLGDEARGIAFTLPVHRTTKIKE
jgi:nitrogen regulatory protein PII